MRRVPPILLASFLFIVACGESPTGTNAPPLAQPPGFLISDANHNDGNAHFFWLPPMVANPGEFNGDFDATVSPVVRIRNLATDALVAEFTMAGAGSEQVRLEDEQFVVNWHTSDYGVAPGTTYRIRVLVAGTSLGFADVEFGANGNEARNLTTSEIIGLVDGRTLPIKFRIEEGAVFVVSPSTGGTVTALGGAVKLDVPAGALTTETGITVEATPPTGGALTAVTFGPAGTQFSQPVPVTIGFNPAALPPGVTTADLALNLLDAQGRWVVMPNSVVDDVANTVTAPFYHFSTGGAGTAALALWCPGDTDSLTFESLDSAVAAIMPGGTVEVCAGTHPVRANRLRKPMTLEGAAGTRPILETSDGGSPFGVAVSRTGPGLVTIRNLHFRTGTTIDFDLATALLIDAHTDQVVVEDVDLEGASNYTGSAMTINQGGILTNPADSSRVTLRNATITGGRNGVYVTSFGPSSDVVIQNSTFSGTWRAIMVAPFAATTRRTRIENVTITNPIEQLAVHGLNRGTESGPLIDVINSDISGGAISFHEGATGLIQGNTITGCEPSSCIRVDRAESPGQVQLEPVRILDNVLTSATAGSTERGIWMVEPTAAGFQITGNMINGAAPSGNRSDPNSYAFTVAGIAIDNADVGGTISDNTIASANFGLLVDGGTAKPTGLDNIITGVRAAFRGQLQIQSSDLTDYIVPIDPIGPFAPGDFTCNWWGDPAGPVGVDPAVAIGVYTPWAVAAVAGTSTTGCPGTVPLAAWCPGDADPLTFESLDNAVAAIMPGGTVEVCAGTHPVRANRLRKPMTLEGAAGTRPILETSDGGSPFGVAVSRTGPGLVTIRNLHFRTGTTIDFDLATALLIDAHTDQVVVEDVDLEGASNYTGSAMTINQGGILTNPADSSRVTLRNATITGGRNGVYVTSFGPSSDVVIQNSTFSGTWRAIMVAPFAATTRRTRIENVTITNPIEQLAVHGLNRGTESGPLIDVINSDISGGAISFHEGATGLIQGNTITGCEPSSCIRVDRAESPGQVQLEPVRILDNVLTSAIAGSTETGIWMVEPTAAGFQLSGNTINGAAPSGDRTVPTNYAFWVAGIAIYNADVGGTISDNTITGANFGVLVDGGSAKPTGLDNIITGVRAAFGVLNGGQLQIQSSDLADYILPIDPTEPFASGDLTCNWWGDVAGPVGVDPGIAAGVYTPWALAAVAGTSTTGC